MGLAERRAIEDFKSNQFNDLVSKIDQAAGFPLPVTVEWAQLTYSGNNIKYPEVWTKVFFTPVIEALKRIGRDEMGKAALKEGVKSVRFQNTKRAYSPGAAISFEQGVIEIDHDYSNVDDVAGRTDHLVKLIEQKL
jgi:hypothetical protein